LKKQKIILVLFSSIMFLVLLLTVSAFGLESNVDFNEINSQNKTNPIITFENVIIRGGKIIECGLGTTEQKCYEFNASKPIRNEIIFTKPADWAKFTFYGINDTYKVTAWDKDHKIIYEQDSRFDGKTIDFQKNGTIARLNFTGGVISELKYNTTTQAALEWIVGTLLIIGYARRKYNISSVFLTSVSKFKYHFGYFIYAVILIIIFIILGDMIYEVNYILAYFSKIDPTNVQGESNGPIYAAILLTTILPNIPFCSTLDNEIRHFCVMLTRFSISGNTSKDAEYIQGKILEKIILDTQERDKPSEDNLIRAFTALEHKSEYKKFLEARYEEYYAINQVYQDEKIKGTGDLVLSDEKLKLYKGMAYIIACSLLYTLLTREEREIELKKLNLLDGKFDKKSVPVNRIALLGFIVFFGLVVLLLILDSEHQLRGAFQYTIATTIVITSIFHIKAYYHFAKKSHSGARPWGFYVIAGMLSLVLYQIIILAFNVIFGTNFIKAVINVYELSPWYLSFIGLGFFLAYFTDNYGIPIKKSLLKKIKDHENNEVTIHVPSRRDKAKQRIRTRNLCILEGVIFGIVMSFILFICVLLKSKQMNIDFALLDKIGIIIVGSGICGALGAIVPHFYRLAEGTATPEDPEEKSWLTFFEQSSSTSDDALSDLSPPSKQP
jgi:hypothetical protein